MLRVLKPDPSEDGVRHSEMPMSMCEAVSHLRGPGRVPSLPPYPWRSIPNVPGGALLARQFQPHLRAARRPRCDLHVGQPAHHEKAEAATARACLGTQTNSVVDNLHRHDPSVIRASPSIQPCESPGYACITAFEHASVKTRATSSANCCEQHPR